MCRAGPGCGTRWLIRPAISALLLSRPIWLMRLDWPGGALGGRKRWHSHAGRRRPGAGHKHHGGGNCCPCRCAAPVALCTAPMCLPCPGPCCAMHASSAVQPCLCRCGRVLPLQAWYSQLQQFQGPRAQALPRPCGRQDRADPPGGAGRTRQCGRRPQRTGHQPRHGVPQAGAVCGKVLNKMSSALTR